MNDRTKILEEFKRQIEQIEHNCGRFKTTIQDAQKSVDIFGGGLKVTLETDLPTVCYYITLLFLIKETQIIIKSEEYERPVFAGKDFSHICPVKFKAATEALKQSGVL